MENERKYSDVISTISASALNASIQAQIAIILRPNKLIVFLLSIEGEIIKSNLSSFIILFYLQWLQKRQFDVNFFQ